MLRVPLRQRVSLRVYSHPEATPLVFLEASLEQPQTLEKVGESIRRTSDTIWPARFTIRSFRSSLQLFVAILFVASTGENLVNRKQPAVPSPQAKNAAS